MNEAHENIYFLIVYLCWVKSYRLNQVLLFLYWIGLLLLGKTVFLLFHAERTAGLSGFEVLQVYAYGLRLDASMAAYLSVIPFLILLLTPPLPEKWSRALINYYVVILTTLVSLLVSADLQLYSLWGFRLDATPLQYINTPAEMAASAASAPLMLLFGLFLVQIGLSLFVYFRFFQPRFVNHRPRVGYYFLSMALLVMLVLPIRGGWQQIPINQSTAYFSENPFANHSALNVPWNVGYSLSRQEAEENPFQYLPAGEVEKTLATLYQQPETESLEILKTSRPNVLLIILESYTAKFVGSLGGEKGVTPHLDQIAQDGLLFTNFYATADRSEKGLVSILSGYPAQPTTSIVKIPRKAERLPHWSQIMKNAGYATSYYYGGELGFANIKSYLLTGGYQKLIGKSDFPAKFFNSKWGVHDHVLLERVLKDLNQEKQPFFSTVFTLSSHEPYDVPMQSKFPGTDEAARFRNSVYYTDQALGAFISEARKQPWWKNTLVVLVADHGHSLPNWDEQYKPTRFRIPLILTGGAIALTGKSFTKVAGQTDLAYSILKQLKLPTEGFSWSHDLFHPDTNPFAFYNYNNGFGYVTSQGHFSFDNVSGALIQKEGTVTEEDLKNGKALMQGTFEDFLNR